MKNYFKKLFSDKRLFSLLWRVGMMLAAFVVDFTMQNLAGFGLPVWAVGLLGMLLGEASKALRESLAKPELSTGV